MKIPPLWKNNAVFFFLFFLLFAGFLFALYSNYSYYAAPLPNEYPQGFMTQVKKP